MLMAEIVKNSVSLVIATNNGKLLAERYLPLLQSFIQQSRKITELEVLVSDNGTEDFSDYYLSHVNEYRYVKAPVGCTLAKCINVGIYNSSKDLALILNDEVIPADDYLEQTLPLFSKAQNVFGVCATVLESDGRMTLDGAYLPNISRCLIGRTENFVCPEPVYTFSLSTRNMLVDRQKLSLMGGLQCLFDMQDMKDIDCSLRAWRYSWKCIYTPMTSCRRSVVSKSPNLLRNDFGLVNKYMLSYLHTTGWKHFKFMMYWLSRYLISFFWPTASWRSVNHACYLFLRKMLDAHEIRHWSYENIHKSVEDVVNDFFSNNQPSLR